MKKTTKLSNSTKSILISFALLIPMMGFGQDSITPVAKKAHFSIQIGASYKTFTDKKFVEPIIDFYNHYNVVEFYDHQYEKYNKIPTFGLNAGFLFAYSFDNHWGIASGIQYAFRNDQYEINRDSVYHFNAESMRVNCRDIHNVLKFDYYFHNLEIPLMIQYSFNKFTFNGGASISLLTYKKATYTYLVLQNPGCNVYWDAPGEKKTVNSLESTLLIYPTVQISYEMKFGKLRTNPYFALSCEASKQHSLYLRLGMIFPLGK
jgi:hypothetical protein